MGMLNRMSTIVKSKVNKLLDKFEDPRETLDYSYQLQLEALQKVKRGVAEVATSKKRLELQKAKLEQNINRHNGQAREALKVNREDLARLALERKKQLEIELEGLNQQIAELQKEQERLTETEKRLALKVEAFRTKKETIKAQYSAAEAQVKVNEAVSGISEEMSDIGLAIQRAEEKTENMKARAAALDELQELGTLEDLAGSKDQIERELEKMKVGSEVDLELAKLKQEVGKE
ncbi:MAG: PspA/IM30 family protein [Methanophagales archaeon ANME-1-THS]|nr:MAG: PspA/IM30 family protein [Methanophagales archaeon ANME-1-THS]